MSQDTSIRRVLTAAVARGDLPGALSWVRRGGAEELVAVGTLGPGRDAPMTTDAVVRIASLTKPVVAALALALVDDGVLALDAPTDDLLPELADRQVLRDPAGPLTDVAPAARAITLADLLTFRLGLGMLLEPCPLADAMAGAGVAVGPPDPAGHLPASPWLARLASLPLAAQPGERWLYQSSAEVLSVLLARATGRRLGEVLRERLLSPLGMHDTGFVVQADQVPRLTDAPEDPATSSAWAGPIPFENAADGLVSTAADLRRFALMLAGGGTLDGEQVLSPTAHAYATTNHLTDAQAAAGAPFLDGVGWGAGMEVGLPGGPHPGRYGWAGGLGTLWWNDPRQDRQMILLTQLPVTTEESAHLARQWEQAVYAAS